MVVDLQAKLQKEKEEVQLAKEVAEAEKKAFYQFDVEETKIRLAEEWYREANNRADAEAFTHANVEKSLGVVKQKIGRAHV